MDNFDRLDSTKHMLIWLTKEPYVDIRQRTQEMLAEWVADPTIQRFCVTSDPDWLTRVIKQDKDPSQVTVIGVGVAFEFELTVVANGKLQDLSGVLTWVGYDLNSLDKHTKMWLDIHGTLADFGESGALSDRIYLP